MTTRYCIPPLIPAIDSRFDRYKYRIEHNGWLFYIGGPLHDPKIMVFTPEEMASQGRRNPLFEISIDNDEQFSRWVRQFIHANGI